jgi:tetratricopeptide (TPR) repeat protein
VKKTTNLFAFLFLSISLLHGQESPTELFNKAMEFKKSSNCTEVLNLLTKAVALKPDFGEALLEQGWCLNELGRPVEAIPVLQKACGLLKNKTNVYYELGHAWYAQGKTDSALKFFKETLKISPTHQLATISIGDVYREKLNDTREALGWYLKATQIDSSHKKTNYWTGWCYNGLKKHDSAVIYLQKVLDEEPSNLLASFEQGFAYYSLNRYTDAITAFKPTLAVKDKPVLAIYYTGLCNVKTGSKAAALDKYNELVILNSPYAAQLLAEIQKMK